MSSRLAENNILLAAADAFAELGFSATRVEDILEGAGVARRTFYKYFGSKEEVLTAIYALATDEITRAIQNAALSAESADPIDALRLGLDAYLDYHADNARLVRVLVQQAIRYESPLAEHRRRFREDLIRLMASAVRASTGEVHDPMLYGALLSAVEGISLELLADEPGSSEVKRAKAALHLILERTLSAQGVRRRSRRSSQVG
jgi:AcrR family transcriptional regulator